MIQLSPVVSRGAGGGSMEIPSASYSSKNLGLNAGHDLDLDNLKYFKENIPGLLEVSIGHALISEALYYGLENTIQMYLRLLD